MKVHVNKPLDTRSLSNDEKQALIIAEINKGKTDHCVIIGFPPDVLAQTGLNALVIELTPREALDFAAMIAAAGQPVRRAPVKTPNRPVN